MRGWFSLLKILWVKELQHCCVHQLQELWHEEDGCAAQNWTKCSVADSPEQHRKGERERGCFRAHSAPNGEAHTDCRLLVSSMGELLDLMLFCAQRSQLGQCPAVLNISKDVTST